MSLSYGLDRYRSHDLNIYMQTSSGDIIEMDFSNKRSSSISHQENHKQSKDSFSFSSMQSFKFSMQTNGIDAQDKKEIDAFMKVAQPFIDQFLEELDQDAPGSPVTQLARQISDIFSPMRSTDENTRNYTKNSIVKMFDNALKKMENIEKLFEDTKTLLEKTLEDFDKLNKSLYA